MDDRTALTRDLTDLVRHVPGVAAIYSSAPVLLSTVSKVTHLVTQGDVAPDLVHVSELRGDVVVAVTIGVSEAVSATQVCRQVYDVIAEHFALSGAPEPASIAVKVGRIG